MNYDQEVSRNHMEDTEKILYTYEKMDSIKDKVQQLIGIVKEL